MSQHALLSHVNPVKVNLETALLSNVTLSQRSMSPYKNLGQIHG